jgi:hypothetical protein
MPTAAPSSQVKAEAPRSELLGMMKQMEAQMQEMRGELAATREKEECPAGKHATDFNGERSMLQ